MRKSVLVALVAIMVVSATSATAASLITSKQIKDGTIQNRDIKRGTISANRLSTGVQRQLRLAGSTSNSAASSSAPAPGRNGTNGTNGVNGANGADGAKGADGARGARGENADGSVTQTVAGLGGVWSKGDTRNNASVVFGPGGVRIETPAGTDKAQIFTTAFTGRQLADLRGMSYRVIRHEASGDAPGAVPALNMRVDSDGDGVANFNAVYEPIYNVANANDVKTGTWQTWDAYAGKWWVNKPEQIGNKCSDGGGQQCTIAELIAASKAANGGKEPTLANGPAGETGGVGGPLVSAGSLGINQGSGNAGLKGSVEWLTVQIGGVNERYRFGS